MSMNKLTDRDVISVHAGTRLWRTGSESYLFCDCGIIRQIFVEACVRCSAGQSETGGSWKFLTNHWNQTDFSTAMHSTLGAGSTVQMWCMSQAAFWLAHAAHPLSNPPHPPTPVSVVMKWMYSCPGEEFLGEIRLPQCPRATSYPPVTCVVWRNRSWSNRSYQPAQTHTNT